MEIDPKELDRSLAYKLLAGCITPRPIAFVSTQSPEGRHNLAPFSWFNAAGSNPMALMFVPSTKADGTDKDTLRNCLPEAEGGLGEFVVNIVVESFVRQMAASAADLDYGESEFEYSGLTPAPSRVVRPPRVAESPASFECKTRQIVRLNPGAPASGNIVIGEVVYVWIDDRIIDDRHRIDAEKLPTVGRMGGSVYTRTRELFALPRGGDALESALPFAPDGVGGSHDS